MPETCFGLQRRPFPATPDSTCYYPATVHERALGRLLQALRDGEGWALLTGEPGTGKTLLCHCLLERLGQDTTTAFLTNSHLADRTDLLQAILYDLSLPYEARTEQELRLRLTEFLLKSFAAGKLTVLLVDEAHHLTPDLLEEIRLLGNLEAGSRKALQVVLSAQPSILQTLRRLELTALSQRLVVRARLAPLGFEEAADYLLHHLRAAGARPEAVMTPEALEVLARGTQGLPRLLNQAAHQALLLLQDSDAALVDAEVALEALTCLGLETEEVSSSEVQPFSSSHGELGPAPAEAPAGDIGGAETILSVSDIPAAPPAEEAESAEELPSYRLFESPRWPA
jgi:type II secretory pathway predicted ATPase ExeA